MTEKSKALEAKAKGNAAFSAKSFKEAIEHFSEAITHDPRDHVFFSNRSACYASLEQYEKALEDGSECVKLKPDWPKGYTRKGLAEYFLKRYDEAVETYKAGLKLAPEDAALKEGLQKVMDAKYEVNTSREQAEDAMLGKFDANSLKMAAARNPKIQEYMKDAEFMKKINTLMGISSTGGPMREQLMIQLLQQDPRILEAVASSHGLMVRMADEASAPAEAREPPPPTRAVPKAAEKAPEDTRTPEVKEADELKAKGNQFYKKRKFSEAMECYDKALEKVPDDLTYHNNKNAVMMEMGEEHYPKVLKTCEELLERRYEINTKNPGGASFEKVAKVYNRMASVYEKQRRFDEAIAMYNKSLTEDNSRQTRNALRELERAKEKFEQEHYIDPARAEEHREKGNTFFKEKDFVLAKKEYDEAVRRNPQDAKLYSNRAAALTKLLAYPDALRDLDQCLKLDPNFVKAYSRKGAAHFFMKEYHKALEAYDKGLAIDKENDECLKGRDQVLAKIMETQRSGEVDEEQVRHAMADPEIQRMLHDPQVKMFLKDLQENPKEAQQAMRSDPKLQEVVSKLVAAGIIRTK